MKATALSIIEDAYEIALNPTQPYFAQLEPLGQNGELSNATNLKKVIFKLCELVDSQGKELKELRVIVSNKSEITPPIVDVKATNPTKPLTDTNL